MKKLIAVMMVNAALVGCSDEVASRETLRKSGFTDIEITGYKWNACGEDDTYSTGFIATNPTGQRVSGVVCCGIMKACTVRF